MYRIAPSPTIPYLAAAQEGLAFPVNADRPVSRFRTLLVLGRVSNLPTVWTNVAAGWFLSGGAWTAELAWILLGISLLYVAGMTLNDACDASWDARHAPDRPIPAAQIRRGTVWAIGAVQMGTGLAVILWGSTVHGIVLAALVTAIWLYNWLHKRWSGSVLLMGLCRALVYVGAGSAVVAHTDALEVPALVYLLAGGVVVYIAALTLAARQEHLAAPPALQRLPRLMLMLPVLFPPLIWRLAPPGPIVLLLLGLGVLFTGAWLLLVRRQLVERVPKGVALAIAGIALYDASVVAFADWRAGLACLLAFLLTLGLQRVVPAT